MLEMYAQSRSSKGFTTNPTLMRKAGIRDFEAFARDVLAAIPRPADLVRGVLRRLRRDGAPGANDRELGRERLREDPRDRHEGHEQRAARAQALGRGHQAQRDRADDPRAGARSRPRCSRTVRTRTFRSLPAASPTPAWTRFRSCWRRSRIAAVSARLELIWASPREVLNIVQADRAGCAHHYRHQRFAREVADAWEESGSVLARDRPDVPSRRPSRRLGDPGLAASCLPAGPRRPSAPACR